MADDGGTILTIHLLGGFRISAGQAAAAGLDHARVQRLLVYLLLHRRAPRSRQQIAFTLWPDTPDAQALTNLRTLLTRLRQALPDAERFLEVGTHAVRWRQDSPFTLDVADFEAAYAQAAAAEQHGQPAEAILALERAVSLYTGDLLPGWYDEWLAPERERLRQAYLDALERLAALLEQKRSYRQALGYAQRLVRADPLHEAVYRQLMALHLALGDRASALRVYHTCATILRHELGVDPGPVTQAVYQRVLMVDASPAQQEPPVAGASFVGRQAQWQALRSAWRQAAAGKAQVVLISGEAGIGKTRLAEELLAWVQRQGIASAVARCYAGGGSAVAYGPVAEWLRSAALQGKVSDLEGIWRGETARLLPELLAERPDLPPPGPMTEAWQRQRFFQALNRAVLGQAVAGDAPTGDSTVQPLLLLLDDVQWCDRETLDWLNFMLQAHPDAPLLVLGTVRTEEVEQDHPLTAFRLALAQYDLLYDLRLTPLSAAETAALAADLLGNELAPAQAAHLFRDTEGNPLFIVETVRAGIGSRETSRQGNKGGEVEEQTEGAPDVFSPQSTLPPKVRAVIQRRLALLSPAAQALAQTAAVIGREFTFDLLCRASGQDEASVVQCLDELWRRQIVREQGVDAYDFSHDKIRAVAYDGVSPMRRRTLHLGVAAAIETLNGGDLDPVSGQIAVHYELAGRPQQAIGFYRRAATAAQRIYANAEAVQLYRHLLEGELRSDLSLAERCDLMLALGEVWRVTGNWAQAEAINREALQTAEVLDDVVLQARAQCALADVLRLQGHYDSALAWLVKAQDGFEQADHQAGLSRTLWTMGEIYWYQGDNERALTALNRQLDISTQIGDQRGACEALGTLGMIHWSQGDLDQSQDYCERSIALAKAIGHRQALGHAASILGNIGSARHSYDLAFKWGQIFYEIVREVGDRQGLAWALNSFAVDLGRQGDFQRALAYDVLVLPILSEMGDKWSMSIGIHNLGRILRRLDDDRHAEELYRLAIRLGSKLGIPGLLADMEHDLTELLLEQHRLDEADAVFREAQTSAVSVKSNYLGGNDVRFNLSVLGVRLRHAQGYLTQSQAVARFERLLTIRISREQQAELHWRAWQTDSSLESHRLAAAKQFYALATSTSAFLFRQRYHELTGEWLPAPVPPPDLPDVVLQIPVNVESLMAEVRATAAGLLAHSS